MFRRFEKMRKRRGVRALRLLVFVSMEEGRKEKEGAAGCC